MTADIPEAPMRVTDRAFRAMNDMTTEELVGNARAGDTEAYGMLFHRFHDEIYRFATRRVGDPVVGQDVAADTFADAFAAIGRFRWKGAPFESWLYTIARRRAADHLRRRNRFEPATGPDEGSVSDHVTPVLDAMHMRTLLAQLPETDREVLELRFMEDLDVEQTGRRLGKSPGAVRVAQHRALARLRLKVQEGVA